MQFARFLRPSRLVLPTILSFSAFAANAQVQQPATPPSLQAQADKSQSVAPAAPVMTLQHLCSQAANPKISPSASTASQATAKDPAAGCDTVITRQDFDQIVSAINPAMPAAVRTRLAQQYARALVMAGEAHRRGLENDADVQTLIRLNYLQTLANVLDAKLHRQAESISNDQIEQYYNQHKDRYEEARVRRLFIPKISSSQQLDPAKQKQLADSLQKRAASGEDFDTLQKQAFTDSAIQQPPPPTDTGVRRHGSFPAAQESAIFSLEPGQVSSLLEDANAFYVYKVESKSVMPLSNATQEIKQVLALRDYSDQLRQIFGPVQGELNPDYFNGLTKLDWNIPGVEAEAGHDRDELRPAPATAPAKPSLKPPGGH